MNAPKKDNSNEPKKPVIAWIFFAILILFSLTLFIASPFAGLLFLLAALITCPPVWNIIQTKFKISNTIRISTAIVLFIIACLVVPPSPDNKKEQAALAEQERIAQEQAERQAEQERIAKEQAEKQAEQERIAKEQAEKQAEQERIAKEQAEKQAEQERIAKEQAEAQAEQERIAKEQAEAQAEQERIAKEQAAATQTGQESNAQVTPAAQEANPQQQQTAASYVLNTNTKKFHYPTCSSVSQISQNNYATSDLSRDDLINQGYSPCKRCNP